MADVVVESLSPRLHAWVGSGFWLHIRLGLLCQADGHQLCGLGLTPGRKPLDRMVTTVMPWKRGTHNTGCWARAEACPAGPGRSTREGTVCQGTGGTRAYPNKPSTPDPWSWMRRQRVPPSRNRQWPISRPHPSRTLCGSLWTGTQSTDESQPETGREDGAFQNIPVCP